MRDIWIYFEGQSNLRPGFKVFFSELYKLARQHKVNLDLFAAKDGPRDFEKAPRRHPNTLVVLLKDSEQPFDSSARLCKVNGIDPKMAGKVFWMIESMESWFLADPDALATYYGQNFKVQAIGQTANVEAVPKVEVFSRLKSATARTTKGEYNKTAHAPDILERLNPARVQERAPNCRRFFEYIRGMLSS
jgi:hypothetical protein